MKFKKLVSVTLAAVLALGVVGCGGGSDEAASSAASDANVTQIEAENPWEATVKGDGSLDRVKEAGVIKAGLDDSYPPMGYTMLRPTRSSVLTSTWPTPSAKNSALNLNLFQPTGMRSSLLCRLANSTPSSAA